MPEGAEGALDAVVFSGLRHLWPYTIHQIWNGCMNFYLPLQSPGEGAKVQSFGLGQRTLLLLWGFSANQLLVFSENYIGTSFYPLVNQHFEHHFPC
jgi:hypothetical protein